MHRTTRKRYARTSFAQALRSTRRVVQWPQHRMAHFLGASPRTLIRWETGDTQPTPQRKRVVHDSLNLLLRRASTRLRQARQLFEERATHEK